MKLPPDVLRCLTFSVPTLIPQLLVCVFSLLVSFSLSLLSSSCLHRALLTGLTSNPHINDLHLDISGCEVSAAAVHGIKLNQTGLCRRSSRISAQETRNIPESDSRLRLACFFFFSVCLQLRSAGAAVIQELFPRVVSIATLDISDNGTSQEEWGCVHVCVGVLVFASYQVPKYSF